MTSNIPVKKLLKTSLYTSILVGAVLTIAPLATMRSVSVIGFSSGILLHTLFIFFIWLINISLVYLIENYGWRKFSVYLRYILSYIICIGFIVLVSLLRILLLPNDHDRSTEHFLLIFIILGLAINTIVIIMQDLIVLKEKKAIIEVENVQLRMKNIEATNQQLKQQIHPHFLFNSLNILKTLIKRNPDKAEDYLVKLSGFLRASIASDAPNVVKLSHEIKLCIDYLEMQKMRFNEALQFTNNIPEQIQDSGFVPVFSLLPLLENAIKHNVLTSVLPLHIKIEYEDDRIITTNNLQPKLTSKINTGVGLANLTERYKILSGDEVIIRATEEMFSVSIKIIGNGNNNYRR